MHWNDVIGRRVAESSSQLEEQFSHEILVSERFRATILAALFFVALVPIAVAPILFSRQFLDVFGSYTPRNRMLLLLLFGLGYELLIRHVIGRLIANGRHLPAIARYGNVIVETSLPSVALLILAAVFGPTGSLSTAVPFFYFILIVLSTLRLDFRLCLFTGFVAALEYTLLALLFIESVPGVPLIFSSPLPVLGKGLVIFLSGIVAGFVALQIRERVLGSFKVIEERNQVVGLFGQQVSQAIVDELLRSGLRSDSLRRQVCVMFLDIRDFTPFAEKRAPEEIVAYLNTLFDFMIESVSRHHGIINQFVGDGFMATFGAPLSSGNDCLNAVTAAAEIVENVHRMAESGAIPPTRIGIGVHTGEAVTGNVGSSLRQQYSITGNVVILASRIEQLNKLFQSQLLISHDVWQAIGERQDALPMGPVQVKGHREPIAIYRLA